MAYRGKGLAGTCGIPSHDERAYVEVEIGGGENGQIVRPVVEFGCEAFGNLVIRWEVAIGRAIKALWHDRGRWFVRAKTTS